MAPCLISACRANSAKGCCTKHTVLIASACLVKCQHQEVTIVMLQEFPDIDSLYKSRTLARLVAREQYDIAATFVGQDQSLQVGSGRSSRFVSSQLQLGMLTREAVHELAQCGG